MRKKSPKSRPEEQKETGLRAEDPQWLGTVWVLIQLAFMASLEAHVPGTEQEAVHWCWFCGVWVQRTRDEDSS